MLEERLCWRACSWPSCPLSWLRLGVSAPDLAGPRDPGARLTLTAAAAAALQIRMMRRGRLMTLSRVHRLPANSGQLRGGGDDIKNPRLQHVAPGHASVFPRPLHRQSVENPHPRRGFSTVWALNGADVEN